ncbi:NFACT RNA binding domain-containing protein [Paenibacillus sp. LHD-117]|uniref:Rqc2 family fibronectin-binding protein n=1 Tax=Paenibacillus sp. LHD-117 TaxID=3071412 RepID=UPI0027DFF13F|nr:NFACT RNA binding domain-containing protein [Paenibacillus sp. LHD-117]MDQ6420842.1 NFACT RNA binding domain-containing protein [Paenibacillus sp. LHD-117]
MALDGIVTRALVHDLQRCVGARIHKIHQPTEHELVIAIRGGGFGGKLLLSANPTYPRVHWTTASYLNPLEAPMFCMLLRKHCESGVIEAVRQVGNERIIHIDVRHRDELGDLSSKRIIIEIMGRHSNIILMDPSTGLIHDGIHHVTPAISAYRIVMPGSAYTSPPDQNKEDPLEVRDESRFESLMSAAAGEEDTIANDAKTLVAAFSGLSPLLAKEIVFRSRQGQASASDTSGSALWDSFREVMDQVRDHRYEPVISTDAETGKASFSILPLTHIHGAMASFENASDCLEAFYGDKAERDTVKQRAADLIRFVQNEKAKNAVKIKKLEETLQVAKDAEKYRVLGELLTAYMHQIKRGDTSVALVNFYDEEAAEVTIELDPQLNPSENAQRYFRRYTKHRNSLSIVGEQMDIAAEEIRYFESLLQQLDNASLADIEEIRDELVQQGYMRERNKRGPKRKKPARPSLLCYTSSEGVQVYVGKNNTQNEYLTNRLAAPSDTWLHTKDIPGSHVVIRGGDFGDATLEEAAMLAAHYSQAKQSSMVPVDYTYIRHVRKPSGAKPGFVIYDNQKTLFITPDEQRMKSLASEVKS